MGLGRIAAALACFLVFGGTALAMGASARSDWREGRGSNDNVIRFYALQQWWPAFLAALVALGGPVLILLGR